MGFTLLSKSLATPMGFKSDGSNHANNTEKFPESGSSSSKSRPKKLLSNLTTRLGKDKKTMATPSFKTTTVRTPATELMTHTGVEMVLNSITEPKPIHLEYHDSVTHSLLEEQEWIRQQLFYADAEEGVEVTAQFQHSSPSTHRRRRETDSTPAEISVPRTQTTPTKTALDDDDDDDDLSIPATPELDESERDPLAHFPAVAAAVAKAQEEKTKRTNIQTASTTTTTTTIYQQKSAVVSPSPEKPFDETNVWPEDPTIMEIENAQSKDSHESALFQDDQPNRATSCGAPVACAPEDEVARQLLDVFHCGDDFTEFSGSAQQPTHRSCRLVDAFYDNSCWTHREAIDRNRPFYDEAFARRFLKDIANEGINVLWHLPPENEEDAVDDGNWCGRSVLMKIQPGSCYSTNGVEPKLVWTTLGSGKGRDKKVARCLVPLLAIQSISTFREALCDQPSNKIQVGDHNNASCGANLSRPEDDDEDVCLFSITTEEGDVQVFEAATPRERDLFVTGLKNVIARLSFHVIVGDAGASSELYYEGDQDAPPGELPSFANPIKNMNRLAHALMD